MADKAVIARPAARRNVDAALSHYLNEGAESVFYLERIDHIDAGRVLHDRRDLPVWMRQADGDGMP